MPMTRWNQRTFHRTLYGPGILETVTLLKRGPDQRQGTVTAYTLFDCRRKKIFKTGEPVQGDMTASRTATWQLPKVELERVGVHYISALDRIVDREGWWWQPESSTMITVQLMLNFINVDCESVNPPDEYLQEVP